MGGIIIGSLCAIGFVTLWRRERRRACGGRRGRMARRFGKRLDATPEQQRVIDDAVDAVGRSFADARRAWSQIRSDLARTLRGDDLDEEALAAARDKAKGVVETFEASLASALRDAHRTLNPEQRARLASRLEHGRRARCC